MATCKKLTIGDSGETSQAVNCGHIIVHNNGSSEVLIDFDKSINADSYCVCANTVVEFPFTITTLYLKSTAGDNEVYLAYE